jgi:hypothetical protein
LRAVNEIGHNVGLIIGSQPKSDGPHRSLTSVPPQPASENLHQTGRSSPPQRPTFVRPWRRSAAPSANVAKGLAPVI